MTPLHLRRWFVALVVALAFAAAPLLAQKTVHVREYTRKDGTVVHAHERSAPRSKSPATTTTTQPIYMPAPATTTATATQASPTTTTQIARDENGRIKRSQAARHSFMILTGFPKGRPGYIIDHVVPLACGGADSPFNMQWQTVADAKAKDKTERVGC